MIIHLLFEPTFKIVNFQHITIYTLLNMQFLALHLFMLLL